MHPSNQAGEKPNGPGAIIGIGEHARRCAKIEEWKPTEQEFQIYARHLRGETQSKIAGSLGVSQQAISEAYRRTRAWLARTEFENACEVRREIDFQYRIIIEEAMQAWDRSKSGKLTEVETVNGET